MEKASYAEFFHIWAAAQGWKVPLFHYRIADWLEHRGDIGVLQVFRGAAKSTHLAIYNAWRYHSDPAYRILHQGDQDGTAYKTARDTKNVLQRHPLTRHMGETSGEISFWWVPGASDARNPSMQAAGILSNITSSRADEIQNDDVEVPRNIATPEAREKLRFRLSEQTHILVPGGRILYVGTPHTHDSIYDEEGRKGADVLKIPLFGKERRIENAPARVQCDFVPDIVFTGIGEFTTVLKPGVDYQQEGNVLVFGAAPTVTLDLYGECAWPERFDRKEIIKRRKKCRTINEWDSQYQLHSKPIRETRLDPGKIIPYAVEPVIRHANKTAAMFLGQARIAGMSMRWDPSAAKMNSDVSALALLLQDEQGRRYLHRVVGLTGEIAEFSADGKHIIGGQVWQIADLVERYHVPRIVIETNGIGAFAPAVLKAVLKQRKLTCGVAEETATTNKNKRILEAFEPVMSANMLWAHTDVLSGPLWDQMKDFNPATQNQADDYIDAGAGAITDTPERIKVQVKNGAAGLPHGDWRPVSGVHEAAFER